MFYGEGSIFVGEHSYIGGISTIQSVNNAIVTIGKNCQISHNVRIYTKSMVANHDFSNTPIPTYIKDVSVGDYCWIGANVFINPGVTIGSNSVIGANAVVTGNVPENEVWGGVPAKLIRRKG
ncbi:DapH/DapD/GlmU-related protein [Colwelliaceae bacterium BS250]